MYRATFTLIVLAICLIESKSLLIGNETNGDRYIVCPTIYVSGQFGYPPDCSQFVNCFDGVPALQECPPGTLFDVRLGICDWDFHAKCATYGESPLQWGIGA